MPAGDRRARGQAGFSLLEGLTALALIAVVTVGLVSLLYVTIVSSSSHRARVAAGNQATTVAEAVDRLPYQRCGQAQTPQQAYASALSNTETGYTASFSSITFLQSAAANTTAATFASTCPTPDQGVQRIVVTVSHAATGTSVNLELLKRNRECPVGAVVQSGQEC